MATMASSNEGPDQGRAWLIAFAACIINMILSGISRMIGILYVAVIDEYGVSRQEATTPFSVRNSIRCLAGPLVGLVGQMVKIRTITFCGGVVAALGACLCSIAPNITWMTILWGGVHGIGFAFANTLFQVIVNQYFVKHRATASGIALSGACVGSLGFPFLFETIIEKYRLSGAFLILGGVVMHVLPFSLLLCSPPWLDKKKKKTLKLTENGATGLQGPSSEPEVVTRDTGDSLEPQQDELAADEEEFEFRRQNLFRSTSVTDYPENIQCASAESRSLSESIRRKKSIRSITGQATTKDSTNSTAYTITEEDAHRRESEVETPTISSISMESVTRHLSLTDGEASTAPNGKGLPNMEQISSVEDSTKRKKKGLRDNMQSFVSLYTNPVYVLISVSMCTYVIIFIPILTVIVDYGKDKDMTEAQGKYLINALAIGDLFGRLCFGWVTDKKYMATFKFMALCQVMQGGVVAMFPLTSSLFTFMLLLALYGMSAGMVLVQFPVLVLKYVCENEQAVAMGSVGFLSGIVTFAIPPLIGVFRDKIGSYDGMFFFIGAVSLFSGAVWLLEPIMVRKLRRHEEKRAAERRKR